MNTKHHSYSGGRVSRVIMAGRIETTIYLQTKYLLKHVGLNMLLRKHSRLFDQRIAQ